MPFLAPVVAAAGTFLGSAGGAAAITAGASIIGGVVQSNAAAGAADKASKAEHAASLTEIADLSKALDSLTTYNKDVNSRLESIKSDSSTSMSQAIQKQNQNRIAYDGSVAQSGRKLGDASNTYRTRAGQSLAAANNIANNYSNASNPYLAGAKTGIANYKNSSTNAVTSLQGAANNLSANQTSNVQSAQNDTASNISNISGLLDTVNQQSNGIIGKLDSILNFEGNDFGFSDAIAKGSAQVSNALAASGLFGSGANIQAQAEKVAELSGQRAAIKQAAQGQALQAGQLGINSLQNQGSQALSLGQLNQQGISSNASLGANAANSGFTAQSQAAGTQLQAAQTLAAQMTQYSQMGLSNEQQISLLQQDANKLGVTLDENMFNNVMQTANFNSNNALNSANLGNAVTQNQLLANQQNVALGQNQVNAIQNQGITQADLLGRGAQQGTTQLSLGNSNQYSGINVGDFENSLGLSKKDPAEVLSRAGISATPENLSGYLNNPNFRNQIQQKYIGVTSKSPSYQLGGVAKSMSPIGYISTPGYVDNPNSQVQPPVTAGNPYLDKLGSVYKAQLKRNGAI